MNFKKFIYWKRFYIIPNATSLQYTFLLFYFEKFPRCISQINVGNYLFEEEVWTISR